MWDQLAETALMQACDAADFELEVLAVDDAPRTWHSYIHPARMLRNLMIRNPGSRTPSFLKKFGTLMCPAGEEELAILDLFDVQATGWHGGEELVVFELLSD